MADEYDAAQKRGEVATRQHNPGSVGHVPEQNMPATAADIGLSRKEIHEARTLGDAEKAQPGVIRDAAGEVAAKLANMGRTDTLAQNRSAKLPDGAVSQSDAAKLLNVSTCTVTTEISIFRDRKNSIGRRVRKM